MSELELRGKLDSNEKNSATYTIKKIHTWAIIIGMFLSVTAYILYREFNYDSTQADHERRITKLEGHFTMITETKLNLEQFLTKQGYQWIKIPQPDNK